MRKYPIVHIELSVADREAAAAFYRDLFGWSFSHYPDQRYTTFEAGEISGMLNADPDALGEPGSVLIYVGSHDVAADLAHAEALGAEVIVPRVPIPGVGWLGVFADPAGNLIGLLNLQT